MNTPDWGAWERARTDQVIDSINAVRGHHGMTVKALQERVNELGWRVSLATLNGMLSAKKRNSITIAEIEVIALALEIPPAYLVLGLPKRSQTPPLGSVLDDLDVTELATWWLAGEEFADDPSPLTGGSLNLPATYSLRALRDFRYLVDGAAFTNAMVRQLAAIASKNSFSRRNAVNVDAQLEWWREAMRYALRKLYDSYEPAKNYGLDSALPELPPALKFLDDRSREHINDVPLPIEGLGDDYDEVAVERVHKELNLDGKHPRA